MVGIHNFFSENIKPKKIISFSGSAGSGKDTAASFLIEKYGFTKFSFAGILKDIVADLFSWPRHMVEGDTKDSRAWREQEDAWWTERLDFGVPITPRWVLQYIGTEVFRNNFQSNIWVLALERAIDTCPTDVVITDARFFQEFEFLKAKQAKIVGLHRVTPKWLDKFYKGVEAEMEKTEWTWSTPTLNTAYLDDLAKAANQVVVKQQIKGPNGHLLHSSEYLHFLWQWYDVVIENKSDVNSLFTKVETFV